VAGRTTGRGNDLLLSQLNAEMQGDIDNIVKPILDAITAIVYPDDRTWSACSRSGSNLACSGRSRPIAFKW
jgi:hypothetical protein